jgi:hypothetical protein
MALLSAHAHAADLGVWTLDAHDDLHRFSLRGIRDRGRPISTS